jgi:hypothetical protein
VCVQAQRPTSHTHSCMNAIERTLVRSIARILSHHVTLFRSLSSLLPLIFHLRCTLPPPHLCSHFTQTLTQHLHTLPPTHFHYTTPPLRHHRTTILPPLVPFHSLFSPFSIVHKTQLFPYFRICPDFEYSKCSIHPRIVLFPYLCWFLPFLPGVGVDFRAVFQTFVLRVAHHMFDEIPQRVPACLEGKFQLLGLVGPKPW